MRKRQHIHQLRPKQPKLGLPLSPCSAGGMSQEGWGAWKGSKAKESFYREHKHPFPLHHKQAPTTPSRVFPRYHQLSTISQCKNRVFPGKAPSQKNPIAHGRHQEPEQRVGKGSQVPGVLQLDQVHHRPWNFHLFSGTKQTRCKQQLLPHQPQHPRLHAEPNYIKAAFLLIKSLSSTWTSPSHVSQRLCKVPGEVLSPAPCGG